MLKYNLISVFILLNFIAYTQIPTVTIQLLSSDSIMVGVKSSYNEPGFNALDSAGNNYNQYVTLDGKVDTNLIGEYILTYSISPSIANAKLVSRKVVVLDTVPPEIFLLGENPMTFFRNSSYSEILRETTKLRDNYDTEDQLFKNLIIDYSNFDSSEYGIYLIVFKVSDNQGNKADSVIRYVIIDFPRNVKNSINQTINLSPNPSRDYFILKGMLEIKSISASNNFGQYFDLPFESRKSETIIKTDELVPGNYYLKIASGDKTEIFKLVISE